MRTGTVLVTSERALPAATWATVAAATGVTVRSEVAPLPSNLHTYGGRTLKLGTTPQCTTGFTVSYQGTGERAVVTSAHCPDNLNYYQTDSLWYALTFRGAMYDGNQDVQWHTHATHAVFDDFWDGAQYRDVTGTHTRNGSIGTFICHYGYASAQESAPKGQSCGTVQSITYDPGDICGGPCQALWVKVTGPLLACSGGDSGGPFFVGGVAYGILKAGVASQPGRGYCTAIAYMSVDLLPPMALYVLTQ